MSYNVFLIVGQRKCSYEGQYAPETLECIDEYGNDDNPDFLCEKMKYYKESNEFSNIIVVKCSLDNKELDKMLNPENKISVTKMEKIEQEQ